MSTSPTTLNELIAAGADGAAALSSPGVEMFDRELADDHGRSLTPARRARRGARTDADRER